MLQNAALDPLWKCYKMWLCYKMEHLTHYPNVAMLQNAQLVQLWQCYKMQWVSSCGNSTKCRICSTVAMLQNTAFVSLWQCCKIQHLRNWETFWQRGKKRKKREQVRDRRKNWNEVDDLACKRITVWTASKEGLCNKRPVLPKLQHDICGEKDAI